MIGTKGFKIIPGHWYGWQMLPGYAGPYYSPIRIKQCEVAELESALNVAFHNLCYASGVRNFETKLTNVFWTDDFVSGTIDNGDLIPNRLGIITAITPRWISHFCKDIGSDFQTFDGGEQDLFERLEIIANRSDYG